MDSIFDGKRLVVATTLKGLETELEKEMHELGFSDTQKLHRAVQVETDLAGLYRLNLHSRLSLRLLYPLFSFKAKTTDELYQKAFDYNWLNFLTTRKTFAVQSVVNSKLFTHSQFVSLRVKDAIADRFRKELGARPYVDIESPDFQINVHIFNDQVDISLDSSAIPLYKRGYRSGSHPAQLNEVLAAGLIRLSGWDRQSTFIDPMCGSGTLAIEAALMAYQIPPGIFRSFFGFEKWPGFDRELFSEIAEESNELEHLDIEIIASDVNKKFVQLAEGNAAKISLSKKIKFFVKAFEDFKAPRDPGTIIMNPPYGERLQKWAIDGFYQKIGERLKHEFDGFDAWVLSSNQEAMKHIGLRSSERFHLLNGDLDCIYASYSLYRGSKKGK